MVSIAPCFVQADDNGPQNFFLDGFLYDEWNGLGVSSVMKFSFCRFLCLPVKRWYIFMQSQWLFEVACVRHQELENHQCHDTYL